MLADQPFLSVSVSRKQTAWCLLNVTILFVGVRKMSCCLRRASGCVVTRGFVVGARVLCLAGNEALRLGGRLAAPAGPGAPAGPLCRASHLGVSAEGTVPGSVVPLIIWDPESCM